MHRCFRIPPCGIRLCDQRGGASRQSHKRNSATTQNAEQGIASNAIQRGLVDSVFFSWRGWILDVLAEICHRGQRVSYFRLAPPFRPQQQNFIKVAPQTSALRQRAGAVAFRYVPPVLQRGDRIGHKKIENKSLHTTRRSVFWGFKVHLWRVYELLRSAENNFHVYTTKI
jgi:hypothetical protein